MNKYVLKDGIVVAVNPTDDLLNNMVFMEDYDTIAELEEVLNIGDPLPPPKPFIPEPSRIRLPKLKVFYTLAANGLLDRSDIAARQMGSVRLREMWLNQSNMLNGSWAMARCSEIVEMIDLIDITLEENDIMFLQGYYLDIQNPKEGLDEKSCILFDLEIRIWELKGKLESTDYVEMPSYDRTKDDLIEQRQQWRNEIRSLRAQIAEITGRT